MTTAQKVQGKTYVHVHIRTQKQIFNTICCFCNCRWPFFQPMLLSASSPVCISLVLLPVNLCRYKNQCQIIHVYAYSLIQLSVNFCLYKIIVSEKCMHFIYSIFYYILITTKSVINLPTDIRFFQAKVALSISMHNSMGEMNAQNGNSKPCHSCRLNRV